MKRFLKQAALVSFLTLSSYTAGAQELLAQYKLSISRMNLPIGSLELYQDSIAVHARIFVGNPIHIHTSTKNAVVHEWWKKGKNGSVLSEYYQMTKKEAQWQASEYTVQPVKEKDNEKTLAIQEHKAFTQYEPPTTLLKKSLQGSLDSIITTAMFFDTYTLTLQEKKETKTGTTIRYHLDTKKETLEEETITVYLQEKGNKQVVQSIDANLNIKLLPTNLRVTATLDYLNPKIYSNTD